MSIRIIAPKSWHSLLFVTRERPDLYLGSKTLKGLHYYIDGVFFAEHMYDIPRCKKMIDFDWARFEPWVQKEKNKKLGYYRSFGIAAKKTKSDEEAFDLWFSWYDEFNLTEGKEDYENWKKNNEQQELHRYTTKDEGDPSLY